jgi:hypothetical protein
MAVRCTGEATLLEQLGERQDFECLLTALGLRHEDFALSVRRVVRRNLGDASVYAVTVIRHDRDVRHVYLGGPAHAWTERFAANAARGRCEPPATSTRATQCAQRDRSGFQLCAK